MDASKEQVANRVGVEAKVNPRTVRRYLDGFRVMPIVADAIEAAAKKLKIQLKPYRAMAK